VDCTTEPIWCNITTYECYCPWLYLGHFNFSLPANSTVLGITLTIRRGAENKVLDAGIAVVLHGRNYFTPSSGSFWEEETKTYPIDSKDKKWGREWTADEVNSESFGVGIRPEKNGSSTAIVRIYCVQINVTYCTTCTHNTGSGGDTGGPRIPLADKTTESQSTYLPTETRGPVTKDCPRCVIRIRTPMTIRGDFKLDQETELLILEVPENGAGLTVTQCLILEGQTRLKIIVLETKTSPFHTFIEYQCIIGDFSSVSVETEDENCTSTSSTFSHQKNGDRAGRLSVLVNIHERCIDELGVALSEDEKHGVPFLIIGVLIGVALLTVIITFSILYYYKVIRKQKLKESRSRMRAQGLESSQEPEAPLM